MSLAELLPSVQTLSRIEKLRLIELVAADLARSEDIPDLQAGQTYEIWSPHDAYQAAEVLREMLEKEKSQP
jgi:hypothetical protein